MVKEKLQTASPQETTSLTIPTTLDRSIIILVELYKTENGKILKTNTLIDSGATICCIDCHLVNQMKWPLKKLPRSMLAQNTDRTENTGGTIKHQVQLHLRIQGRTTTQTFYVLNLGKRDNIILGYPWLTKNNLQINWGTREVQMIGTLITHHDNLKIVEQQYLLQYLGALERDESEYATQIYAQQLNTATFCWIMGEDHPEV